MKQGIALGTALLATACQSTKETANKAGLAVGVAAMAAASPLIPVVDGVRTLSGDRERTRNAVENLRTKLDPIFENRIAAILARDPIADASLLYTLDHVDFLTRSRPGGFPGVNTLGYDVTGFVPRRSSEGVPLFTNLEALLIPRPEELRPDNNKPRYGGPVFHRFNEAAGLYMAGFNREIYRRWKLE